MPKLTENVSSADNQQETPPYGGSSETTREAPEISRHYLLGAIKDSTTSKYTYRISQKGKEYPTKIANALLKLGYKAWVYKEGKNRDVYVVEFSKKILDNLRIVSLKEKGDYIRGYFDAEGGVARSVKVRPYIYFCQKNYSELNQLKQFLTEFNIFSGKIHNPSIRVDPEYWRFYVSTKSHKNFVLRIGSSHPSKSKYLRMMI